MDNQCFEDYLQCFYSFLDARKLNRSSERNAVLLAIYNYDKHFTLEDLQKRLKRRKHHICQSTLYKTVSLLEEAGLLFKHHLPHSPVPQYEKIQSADYHNHICIEDEKEMIEFSDERINLIKKEIEEKYNVSVVKHSFVLYCEKKGR